MQLLANTERWSLELPLVITGYTITAVEVIVATVVDGKFQGRGEAAGVYYRNESVAHMLAQLEAVRSDIEKGIDRRALQGLLPPGGARNAVDCALWDLEARRTGRAAWEIAGLAPPLPLLTTFTIGADTPARMASRAQAFSAARALKLKLTGDPDDVERVHAVRLVCPEAWIGVDANQGLTRTTLEKLMPALVAADVQLIEQPLPIGHEAQLEGLRAPIPLAADESFQDAEDLPMLVGRFDMVNIKLDKCGGLTPALAIARQARRMGLGVMVGNMLGTSLSTAPAFVLGQLCSIVDLDGPVMLSADRSPTVSYENGRIWCPPEVWGGGGS